VSVDDALVHSPTIEIPKRVPTPAPEPASPFLELFQQAIAKGMDGVAAMETLHKLHTQERDRSARLAFHRALSAFQAACPPIERKSEAEIKTASGTSFKYRYAEFDEIARVVGPPLRDNGFSYSFDTEMDADKMEVTFVLRHVDGHEERSRFKLPTATKSAMSIQQAAGAALSFGKRNAMIAGLGIAVSDPDPDGAGDPSTISEEQAANLRAMIDEAPEAKREVVLRRFLSYMATASIAEIRAADFKKAVGALETWKRGAK